MDIRKFFSPPKQTKAAKNSAPPSKDIRSFFGTSSSTKPSPASIDKGINNKEKKKDDGKAKNDRKTSVKTPNKDRISEKSPKKINQSFQTRTSPRKKNSLNSNSEEPVVIDEDSEDDIVNDSQDASNSKKKLNGLHVNILNKTNNVQLQNITEKLKNKTDKPKEKSSFKKEPTIQKTNSKDIDEVIEIESVQSSGSSKSKTKSDKTVDKKKNKAAKSPVVNKKLEEQTPTRRSPRKKSSDTKADSKKRKIQNSSDEEDAQLIYSDTSEDDDIVVSRRKRRVSSKNVKKSKRILDSDSDGENPVNTENSKPRRKKKEARATIDDSDGEKKITALEKFFVEKTKTGSSVEKKIQEKTETTKMKLVNPADFFGTAVISRSDRTMAMAKRKHEEIENVVDVDIVLDEEFHDDEDFMKTLGQLDGPNVKKVKHSESEFKVEPEDVKPASLSSKLSAKVKQQSKEASNHNSNLDTKIEQGSPFKPKETTPKKIAPPSPQKKTPQIQSPQKKTPQKQSQKTPQQTKTPISSKKETPMDGSAKIARFQAFKQRAGPQNLGSKEIPEGAENCLEGLTFVITGVLDSIERDDAKSLIEKYGGKVTGNVSGKTSYLVVGREPGDSKITKATKLNIKQLDEDCLFDLIRTLPGKISKYEIQAKEQLKKEASAKISQDKHISKKLEFFCSPQSAKQESALDSSEHSFTQLKNSLDSSSKLSSPSQSKTPPSPTSTKQSECLLWVDKHKPTSLKNIIGQQGDKSNANKLLHWLKNWHENIIVKGLKPSSNFFKKVNDSAGFRAALLSGPPGIGKTTTATLVCKEANFSYVELNASDCRSKRSLKEVVAESLNNQTLLDYIGEHKGSSPTGQFHCIIMDEVDGMAGNEDRGGLQELVQLIKNTKIPIICICNDRNSMKMRTLSNYCLDLKFQRPRVEQIKGAMMSLAFKEGLKIPPAALNEIIAASNHDIRQIIHNMSMWSACDKNLSYEQVKSDAAKAQKDLKLGPFDVCRKVFVNDEETRKMTFNDKSDLFFQDYSFGPLFVHENYPNVIPMSAGNHPGKHLSCLAKTIDSICDGDMVDMLVRKGGNWNLLPTQAVVASVIPGEIMRGSFPQMTAFPQWLGKFSSTNKTNRILQELATHMKLATCCDKRGLNLDYLPALRTCLTLPLVTKGIDGVPEVIKLMDDYDIIKEDFDNILEVTKWPNSSDPMSKLDTKTKATFTRQYNKETHLTPYATGTISKKRRGKGTGAEEELVYEEEGEATAANVDSEEEDEENLESDTMIKAKKPTSSSRSQSSSQQKPNGAKGKSRSGTGKAGSGNNKGGKKK